MLKYTHKNTIIERGELIKNFQENNKFSNCNHNMKTYKLSEYPVRYVKCHRDGKKNNLRLVDKSHFSFQIKSNHFH